MAKNYGKQRVKRGETRVLGQAAWFLVAFSFGYVGASFYDVSHLMQWIHMHAGSSKKPTVLLASAQQTTLPKPTFEFYTILTKDQVARGSQVAVIAAASPGTTAQSTTAVAAAATTTSSSQQPASTTTMAPIVATANAPSLSTPASVNTVSQRYSVQVASFRSQQEAERMKAGLALKGFTVNVVAVTQQQMHWYRVIMGPFASREEALQAQTTFARREHIVGMIRKADV